jgi:hypothetical protein
MPLHDFGQGLCIYVAGGDVSYLHLNGLFTSGYFLHQKPLYLDALYFWPTLPIAVQCGGSSASNPPAPEEEDNIVATLKQSDRVGSINLTVTKSHLEKLSVITRPFSELEELVLLCGDDVPLTLSSTFRCHWWGPRLCTLHLTRVAIPALLHHLFLSAGLVDLRLHEISEVGYISPEAFASALPGMSHRLAAITESLSGLEEQVLLSRDNVQRTLPSAFRCGSRLRTLHSTRNVGQ